METCKSADAIKPLLSRDVCTLQRLSYRVYALQQWFWLRGIVALCGRQMDEGKMRRAFAAAPAVDHRQARTSRANRHKSVCFTVLPAQSARTIAKPMGSLIT